MIRQKEKFTNEEVYILSGITKGILIGGGIIALIPILLIIAPPLLFLLFLVGIIILKVKYPSIKGEVGEWYVNRSLSKLGSNYKIYHDLYVPNEDGGTTQIDHVVTSPYGIFVIETKHYQGWIFGKENQRYWTQVIYKRKERLFNPIWQNYGHIQALKNDLGRENVDYMHSIIAFSQSSTLKFKEDFQSARVIQFPQLTNVIQEWKVRRLSETELKEINRAMKGLVIKDSKKKKQLKKKHVKTLKNNREDKVRKEKESVKTTTCPKCGGKLSMKKGKYGSFYGCSKFPKCRYTKQV